jgi:ATP-dependent Lhr-like helicase
LQRVVIDEVHAFATGKRGDLLALALARLQAIAPDMQRAALSATVADPEGFRGWLAPWGEIDSVALVEGEKGAPPEVEILLPEEASVPWGGHAAIWAIPQLYQLIKRNKTTLVFTNTRFLAEFIFQELWDANDDNLADRDPPRLAVEEARRKVEGAMARGELRALVATASLDSGSTGATSTAWCRWARPRARRACCSDRPRQPPARLPSRAILVPGNRFEFLEAQAAKDAVDQGKRDGEDFRPAGLDVLAQHVMACACAAPFTRTRCCRSALELGLCLGRRAVWQRVLTFVATGGYALKAYDKFKRIVRDRDGTWRLDAPRARPSGTG